jgi:hypothetical protein
MPTGTPGSRRRPEISEKSRPPGRHAHIKDEGVRDLPAGVIQREGRRLDRRRLAIEPEHARTSRSLPVVINNQNAG